MKKMASRVLIALFAGFFLLLSPPDLHAQETQTLYFSLDYMKVPPGGGAEYVAMEQEIWKAVHQERLRRGLIVGWTLYGVNYSSMDTPYDYVTVNIFDDFSKMQGSYASDIIAAAHPDADTAPMMERTGAAREIVHSEVWTLVSAAEGNAPTDWIVVNYMQIPAGGGDEYMAVENDIWKPMHEAAIAAGIRRGWSVYSLMMPYGADMRYNYATVDAYENYGDLAVPISNELFMQAHPNTTEAQVDKMMERTTAARTHLEGQLWQRLDYVNAETTGSN